MPAPLERVLGIRAARHGDDAFVDGLRAVAILAVIVYHTVQVAEVRGQLAIAGLDFNPLFRHGYLGVDLFFILSGYLLARPFFVADQTGEKRPSSLAFWRRRLARIAPAYYLSFFLVIGIFGSLGAIPRDVLTGWLGVRTIAAHLGFVHQYFPSTLSNFGINPPWWTLTVEMTWYLVLPFVVLAFIGRLWPIGLVVAAVITIGWIYVGMNSMTEVYATLGHFVDPATLILTGLDPEPAHWVQVAFIDSLPQFAFTFAVGVVLAKIRVARRDASVPLIRSVWTVSVLLLIVTVVALGASWYVGDSIEMFRRELFYAPLFGLAILLLAEGPPACRKPLEWVGLRLIGWVSFAIYLVHQPIIDLIRRWGWFADAGPWPTLGAYSVTAVVASTCVGIVSWLLVERPFLVSSATREAARGIFRLSPRMVGVAITVTAVACFVIGTRPTPAEKQWAAESSTMRAAGLAPLLTFVPQLDLDSAKSGPMTASTAFERGLITDEWHQFLSECRRVDGPGSVFSVRGPLDVIRASAFACADEKSAAQVIDSAQANVQRFGQQRSAPGVGSPAVVRGFIASPERTEILYRSGYFVVLIDAASPTQARATDYARQVTFFAERAYPMSPSVR